METVSRQWLSTVTLSALLLSGAVQAGGAGVPPVARPAVPAVQPAQTQAQAGRVLLDKALKANGGEALRGLRTMQQRSEMTFVDAQGQPVLVLPATASVDYVNGRVRVTTYQKEQVINEQVLTPQGAFVYTPQSGTVPLPRQEAKSLTDTFFYGAPGLRLGNQGRDSVKNLGEQTWLKVEGRDIKGTVLEVVTRGLAA